MHLRGSTIPRLAVLALIGASVLRLAPPSGAQPSALPAFSGYSTGTVVHAGLLQTALAGPRLLNVDEAFSGATVAAQGTGSVPAEGPGAKAGQIVNEMSREVQGLLPDSSSAKTAGDNAYARGAGLEIGMGESLPANAPQLPIDTVKVSGGAGHHRPQGDRPGQPQPPALRQPPPRQRSDQLGRLDLRSRRSAEPGHGVRGRRPAPQHVDHAAAERRAGARHVGVVP